MPVPSNISSLPRPKELFNHAVVKMLLPFAVLTRQVQTLEQEVALAEDRYRTAMQQLQEQSDLVGALRGELEKTATAREEASREV